MLKSRQLYIVPPRYKKSSHWNIEKIKKQNQTQK